MKSRRSSICVLTAVVVCGPLLIAVATRPGRPAAGFFQRVATFDVDGEVAEIVAATTDGRTLSSW